MFQAHVCDVPDRPCTQMTGAAFSAYHASIRVLTCPDTAPRVAGCHVLPAESVTPVSAPVPSPPDRVNNATSSDPARVLMVICGLLFASAADPVTCWAG